MIAWSRGTAAENDDSPDFSDCMGSVDHIEDGLCDSSNNNAACGYDGGDCCECTCNDDLDYPCGERGGGFHCLDPDSDCGPTPSPTVLLEGGATASPTVPVYVDCGGTIPYIRDGICDADNNNAECGYDGGDCCECTCGARFGCGTADFDCLDPTADTGCRITESPTSSPFWTDDFFYGSDDDDYPDCTGYPGFIQDGDCDSSNNNKECDYDGGDCCECTCVDGLNFSCGGSGYNCVDPEAPTDDDCEASTSSHDGGDDDTGGITADEVERSTATAEVDDSLGDKYVALTAIGLFAIVGNSLGGLAF